MTEPIGRILGQCRTDNSIFREFMAEMWGTFVLIVFGDAVVASVTLMEELQGPSSGGDWLSINIGWGIAVTLGILVSGGASGAHLNPAVTTTMVAIGKLNWKKMFHYILAQYIGAFLGAACVYLVYLDAFQAYFDKFSDNPEQGYLNTMGIFATYPKDYLSIGNGFFDQVLGTFLLLLTVLATTDEKNMKVPSSIIPAYVGLIVLGIGVCFGVNCGYAINPARDLAPRFFTYIAGWGSMVWTEGSYWFWVPIVATHLGGFIGGIVYQLSVGNHWQREKKETFDME